MNINIEQLKKNKFERMVLLNPNIGINERYRTFKKIFEEINGKTFIENEETKKLVFTLIYYFSKKENFYRSPLLFSFLNSKTDLDKGLILVGGFGCGKSSILKTFRHMIIQEKRFNLKFVSTVEAVTNYEINEYENLKGLNDKISKGNIIIDDLLAEKVVSKYGKFELFETILLERSDNSKMTTIITMNFDAEAPNDMNIALHKLSRYGGRVFDRILGNYNFIQLHGKSFRK
jgi:DNA replication protein DnaC